MSDYKHGEMDIKVQEETFGGFINWITKSVIVIIVALILLALINA